MKYWILKTEPNTYSYEDLVRDKKTAWDGVRNYQARNNLRAMQKGDLCFIYHSVGPKEIVGTVKVVKEAYPDATTKDPNWVCVDIEPVKKLAQPISLAALKEHPKLRTLSLVKQSRLSVCPISSTEWNLITKLGS